MTSTVGLCAAEQGCTVFTCSLPASRTRHLEPFGMFAPSMSTLFPEPLSPALSWLLSTSLSPYSATQSHISLMILHPALSKCPGPLSKVKLLKSRGTGPLHSLRLPSAHSLWSPAAPARENTPLASPWLTSSGPFSTSVLADQSYYWLPLWGTPVSLGCYETLFLGFPPHLSGSFWILFLSSLYLFTRDQLRFYAQSRHIQEHPHTHGSPPPSCHPPNRQIQLSPSCLLWALCTLLPENHRLPTHPNLPTLQDSCQMLECIPTTPLS